VEGNMSQQFPQDALPPPSEAHAARAATPGAAVDGGGGQVLDQVLGLLRGSGLEVRASRVENALALHPAGDPLAAARTILDWQRTGHARTTDAGTLLGAALKAQRGSPAAAPDATERNRVALTKQRDWARRHLPHLPEVFVMGTYEVMRYRLGRDPEPPTVAARVKQRLAELEAQEKQLAQERSG
jgi:hypothetical protein